MSFVEVCGIGFGGDHNPVGGLIYQQLIDWDGRPQARGGGDAIPGGQGVFARTQELRESRVISVEAAIVADSADEYFAVKRRVENMPMFGEMRVDQGDGVWVRSIEVESIDIPDARGGNETLFTIDVTAPDPVRYTDLLTVGPVGLPTQSGGLYLPAALPWDLGTLDLAVADVVNTGSLPVLPVVRLTGSASSVVIHGGPRTVSFGAFDGELVIDSLQRRAFLNGADVTRSLILRNWHQVPAGVTHGFFFEAVAPSPGTSMTVEYRIGEW